MSKQSSYGEKKKRGLCGHAYNINSDSFQAGAWKNWQGIPEHQRMGIALGETVSTKIDRGYHCFVLPHYPAWITGTKQERNLEWAYRFSPSFKGRRK